MKNIKLIITSLLILLVSFSCDDQFGDVNVDPLSASSADPSTVFPYVFVQYSNRKTTELGTRITDVSQHMGFNFNSPRGGSTSIFLTGNTWGMMYVQALKNLDLLERDAREVGEAQNNVAALAVILKAMIFYELSSIWEDVPFTEAGNAAEFPSPSFDSQETVLKGCVDLIDDGIALIDATPATGIFNLSVGDMIYEGDLDLWRRFANSLKIRILMMIRNPDPGYADPLLNAALSQPVLESNDQAAMIRYTGAAGQENAFQTIVAAFFGPDNESATVHGPGPPLYDLLTNGNADPRYDLFLVDPLNQIAAYGSGTPANDGSEATFTNDIIRGTYPDIWFLPAEISFYRAELALLGVVPGDQQQLFEDGVRQTIQFWGQDIPGITATIDNGDIDTFIANLGAVTLQNIHEQQYVETFLRPVVAWNHVRRTGIPAMDPPPGATISTILKRFDYPPDEVGSNPNVPVDQLNDVPMWFEN